ncbi:MAG: TonB-dependent receptor, partial [Bacteroidota bacterium]|nr:TonB-dependent receptor [Bacteroidota bacterium]
MDSYGQAVNLSGVVYAPGAIPVPGAYILIEENETGMYTDASGKFSISAVNKGTYTLIVQHVSFQTYRQAITVSGNRDTTIDVLLTESFPNIETVVISGENTDRTDHFSRLDFMLRPVSSSQDLMRLVPGLFIAQHAGGGKAEQIFLRGFDVDHGTDFAISVDGIPVNMVSHAHGQGYADLHFLIPETVGELNVYKGSYSARYG